mgnify:CR=1 FL=1
MPISRKPVLSLLEDTFSISKEHLNCCLWFQHYYQLTPAIALKTVIGAPLSYKEHPHKKEPFKQPNYTLTQTQQEAITRIDESKEQHHYLLGVTGSGKTDIYASLCEKMHQNNKQSLILVPEIALTSQIFNFFTERFGDAVSILHSAMTPAQKRKAKQRIALGHSSVIIGPRSALFCPFLNLGLIIIDEEHEGSYKQNSHPRYLAHSVAKHLATCWKAKVVFGSATPSLDTLHHIDDNHIIKLNERINKQPLPTITLVNSSLQEEQSGKMLSKQSIKAIKACLDQNKQVLLFINRRGYAPYLVCDSCQTPLVCEGCQLSWTYHSDRTLHCHRCQRKAPPITTCPSCKKGQLLLQGLGTQKCDALCKILFPEARIFRLDKDTAKTQKDSEALLNGFRDHGDILIGTQMLAKGLHLPKIELVVVLGTDFMLNFPDFRAAERSYQMIVQVAGRAGRSLAKNQAQILIETKQVEHPTLKPIQHYDLDSLFEDEKAYRKAFGYPPFSTLINVLFSSPETKALLAYIEEWKRFLKSIPQELNNQLKIMGPKGCAIEKIRFHWRWHCLFHCEPSSTDQLKAWLAKRPLAPKNVRVFLDIDPTNLL